MPVVDNWYAAFFCMIDIEENVPLAPLSTLKVGGPARFFVRVETEEHVAEAFQFADEKGIPVFVLGGGSNVVISDKGFPGLVIHPIFTGVEYGPEGVVLAGAGEDWDSLVGGTISRDLAGLECLSGIPGSVGGTPVQNVGAYGQEVSETIVAVHCFDRKTRKVSELNNVDCGFAYRASIFNTLEPNRYVVLSVTFALKPNGAPKVVYKDLVEYFRRRGPSLADVRKTVIEIRRAKSMVIDRNDPNSKSVGSFFKNPVVSNEMFEAIAESFDGVPSFPAGEGLVKIPAAWLIEKSGFRKGHKKGNVGISTNHTLAIINRGGATAVEIFDLMKAVQNGVRKRFDIDLRPEPVFVGY